MGTTAALRTQVRYHRRPAPSTTAVPQDDPLAPARGILISIPISAALWAGLIWLVSRLIDGLL